MNSRELRNLQEAYVGVYTPSGNNEEEKLNVILNYLIDEGYTDTIEGAEVILENMSDEWLENIMEAKYGT